MVLLSVVVVASFNLYPILAEFFARGEQRLRAFNFAYNQIEDLRRIARTGDFLTDPNLDAGGHSNATLEVVIPNGFGLSYSVEDLDRSEPYSSPPDYKRVSVT